MTATGVLKHLTFCHFTVDDHQSSLLQYPALQPKLNNVSYLRPVDLRPKLDENHHRFGKRSERPPEQKGLLGGTPDARGDPSTSSRSVLDQQRGQVQFLLRRCEPLYVDSTRPPAGRACEATGTAPKQIALFRHLYKCSYNDRCFLQFTPFQEKAYP